jgi:hypothetical protein
MTHAPIRKYLAAMAAACLMAPVASLAADPNTTGLPSYPNEAKGWMDDTYRSIPNGQHCTHYSTNTTDSLAAVEAWYRKQLSGAKETDVNKDSLYGSNFKLEGIKLIRGNDIVTISKMANDTTTAIELFKCKDAASHT